MAVESIRKPLYSKLPHALIFFFFFLLAESFTNAAQSDIDCLRSIKSSLEDPLGFLASWNFNNETEGLICGFTGVDCWHDDENRVIKLSLGGMGLRGGFPLGLAGCSSMTSLDLSRNAINGSIPANISRLIGFVTMLDLSSNQLSGEIPADLSNCSFLYILRLDNNRLTGRIPPEMGRLARLRLFTVAGNRLSGPVPQLANAIVSAEDYAGNEGLCGGPLARCTGLAKGPYIPVVVGAAIGGLILGSAVGVVLLLWSGEEKGADPLGNRWARNVKGAECMEVSMSESSVSNIN